MKLNGAKGKNRHGAISDNKRNKMGVGTIIKLPKEKNIENIVGVAAYDDPRGITLIVLVITIVILIILAGVAINMTLGENGIFTKAQYAKEQYEITAVKEKIQTEILAKQAQNEGNISESFLKVILEKYGTINYEEDETTIKSITTTEGSYEISIDEIWSGITNEENKIDTAIAKIGNIEYPTLTKAVEAVPTNNTETTITILEDFEEKSITIQENQNILLDFNDNTLVGRIWNNGKLKVYNGIIKNTEEIHCLYNNPGAILIVEDMELTAPVTVITNKEGTLTVNSGTLISDKGLTLFNNTNGTINVNGGHIVSKEHCAVGTYGIVNVSGGTLESNTHEGIRIYEGGTCNIGNVSMPAITEVPIIIGETYAFRALSSTSVANYYCGKLKWKTAINEGTLNIRSGCSTITSVDGEYNVTTLY